MGETGNGTLVTLCTYCVERIRPSLVVAVKCANSIGGCLFSVFHNEGRVMVSCVPDLLYLPHESLCVNHSRDLSY
jgi:hypothetical protein